MSPVSTLLPDTFLNNYWQRQPCLVTAAFRDIIADINLDRTALLQHATDERLDSRFIQGDAETHNWQVGFGPFDLTDFVHLGSNNWTLLVQDLDKVRDDCHALLRAFDFLPDWRLDDVMASVAVTGGSVGPHVDQYDVFLIQLSGQRHWQWNSNFDPALIDNQPLAVLKDFEPAAEATLQAGDMLYLPPGVAHHGVAVGEDDCITLSVGCRAPSLKEWLQAITDTARSCPDLRYRDPQYFSASNELGAEQLPVLRQMLETLVQQDDQQLLSSFAQLLSEYRLNDELLQFADETSSYSVEQLFVRQPAARMVWHQTAPQQAIVYCNAERISCSLPAARLVTATRPWTLAQLTTADNTAPLLLSVLLSTGGIHPVTAD